MNLITQWIATPNKLYDRLATLDLWTNGLTNQGWQKGYISTPQTGCGLVEKEHQRGDSRDDYRQSTTLREKKEYHFLYYRKKISTFAV